MKEIESISKQTSLFLILFVKYQKMTGENFFPIRINWDEIFFKLKQKYPLYFSRLLFDENGPTSEELDKIFLAFKLAGILTWDTKKFYFNSQKIILQKELDKIPWVKEQTEEIVKEFKKLVFFDAAYKKMADLYNCQPLFKERTRVRRKRVRIST